MEGPPMTFIFHHGGSFKNNEKGSRIYEPDNTEVLMGVDGDTLDVFFVKGYYKELGYAGGYMLVEGMPCMHAISCIQDKNDKRAEEYCHEWLTMESYRKTYAFHVNPVKGQNLWEKTGCPAPVFPPIKPKPGRPTKNRRKDKDEGRSGSKTRIKKKYNPIRCMFYGEVGHNKRTCKMKKQAEAEEEARLMQLQLALTKPNTDSPNELPTDATDATPDNPIPLSVSPPPQRSNAATESTSAKVRERPPKLQVCKGKGKRAASPQPAPPTATTPISAGTIKGSSAATTKKLASFMTFVPTPGFKRPRKKDDAI
ncbi:hypothetical protein Ahy_B10g101343 [Arachis hypogaea]|uniref:PB1-like domain-containing protein n=1 Tax=Arachis hypogaea TaxID=3818 RepID=A0A444WZ92_ARAHY|nr:hypothetical protein Ahy_B10g101343 [Arachis hypogaea]